MKELLMIERFSDIVEKGLAFYKDMGVERVFVGFFIAVVVWFVSESIFKAIVISLWLELITYNVLFVKNMYPLTAMDAESLGGRDSNFFKWMYYIYGIIGWWLAIKAMLQ